MPPQSSASASRWALGFSWGHLLTCPALLQREREACGKDVRPSSAFCVGVGVEGWGVEGWDSTKIAVTPSFAEAVSERVASSPRNSGHLGRDLAPDTWVLSQWFKLSALMVCRHLSFSRSALQGLKGQGHPHPPGAVLLPYAALSLLVFQQPGHRASAFRLIASLLWPPTPTSTYWVFAV